MLARVCSKEMAVMEGSEVREVKEVVKAEKSDVRNRQNWRCNR